MTRQELEQLLEGLSERAESWEEISESLRDSRSRASEGGSGNGSPGGAGFPRSRGTSEEIALEDFTDSELESRQFCMQSSLAGLTALQIANDYRKILDKILEQAEACGWKMSNG